MITVAANTEILDKFQKDLSYLKTVQKEILNKVTREEVEKHKAPEKDLKKTIFMLQAELSNLNKKHEKLQEEILALQGGYEYHIHQLNDKAKTSGPEVDPPF